MTAILLFFVPVTTGRFSNTLFSMKNSDSLDDLAIFHAVVREGGFAKLQLQMMGAFAELERNIIRKRQAEGIAKAKTKGVYKGGQKRIDRQEVRNLREDGSST